jgi:hypothetical protein
MEVLIVGTNHSHQYVGRSDGKPDEFKAYLKALSVNESIDLFAEELNEEAIKRWKAQDSVLRRLARELQKTHVFCDPDSKTRNSLGIPSDKQLSDMHPRDEDYKQAQRHFFPIRERYWLQQLKSQKFKKCLFVLGADHVQSFSDILANNGFSPNVVIFKWPAETVN